LSEQKRDNQIHKTKSSLLLNLVGQNLIAISQDEDDFKMVTVMMMMMIRKEG